MAVPIWERVALSADAQAATPTDPMVRAAAPVAPRAVLAGAGSLVRNRVAPRVGPVVGHLVSTSPPALSLFDWRLHSVEAGTAEVND